MKVPGLNAVTRNMPGFTTLTRVIVLTAFYFVGGMLGQASTFMAGNVSLVWPPAGIALGAIILFGYRFWPGVALGAVLFSTLNGWPSTFFTLGTAVGNSVGAVVCAFLLERFVRFRPAMDRVRDVAGFVVLACLLGTTVNAAFNAAGQVYAGEIEWEDFLPSLVGWWVPNAMAGLVVTPLILAWGAPSNIQWTPRRIIQAVVCAAGLVIGTLLSFNTWFIQGIESYPLAYLPYPFLVWAALRFGQRGATTGTLLVSGLAIYALLEGRGPFVTNSPRDSLMLLGSYIGVLSVTNLLLAASALEREQAERAVGASEKRYRAVAEDQVELISRFLPDGTITFVNDAYCRFNGQTRAELLGSKIMPLLSADDREIPLSYFNSMPAENPMVSFDYKVRAPSGEVVWHQCITRRLMDHAGNTVEFQSVALDITERKRVEEELRKSQEMTRLITENVADLIVVTDSDGRRLYNSPSYRKLLGDPEELRGTDAFAQVHPEDRERVKAVFAETIQTQKGERLEFRFFLPDGSIRYIESVGNWVPGGRGQQGRVVSVARDITERKRFEADLAQARDDALQAARSKAEFLANMSHEIRTPMNGVMGMTSLLLRTELNRQQRDYAETIRSSADSLLTIINDILDFSKIEAGKLTFEIFDFDLRDAVEGSVQLLAAQAFAKRIELAVAIHPELPANVRGDSGRVRQVLTNLLGNAVKFTQRGEVLLRVRRESESESRIVVRFEVADTGIGIPPEVKEKLFQPFSQADSSTTRTYGGTGLGLAISKQLVLMMDGKMGLESEPGKGSTFWFTVPLEKQPAAASPPVKTVHELSNAHVLIVDDVATSRRVLHDVLTTWKLAPEAVADGNQALQMLRTAAGSNPYRLAIIDLDMPGMDGLSLVRSIKADPALAGTRLIMLARPGEGLDDATLKLEGIDDWMFKPIRQSVLFDSLINVLVGRGEKESRPVVAEQRPAAGEKARQMRLLLAEDNIINQKVALGQLKELGYAADTVANGLEVLEALQRIPYDVVLMDCQMPELDGYEATARIREWEKAGQLSNRKAPVHVIAMTANVMAGDRERCLTAGMNDYVSKPVEEDELEAALNRWLSQVQAPAEVVAVQEEPPPPKEVAPVDLNRLNKVTGGDRDRIGEIVELYLSQGEETMAKLEAAIQAGAADEVGRLAHKYCGASSTCGVVAMVPLLRELESMGRTGDLSKAAALFEQTKQTYERVRQFFNEMQ